MDSAADEVLDIVETDCTPNKTPVSYFVGQANGDHQVQDIKETDNGLN